MKPMTNSHLLGYIGECVVAKYFGATMSKDRYDDEKDMILPDGTFAEVKTQNRFKCINAFTVDADKSSNLNKCLTVDKLFLWNSIGVIKYVSGTVSIEHTLSLKRCMVLIGSVGQYKKCF